ncbi:N-acetylmuramoyl-L-alanine amidase family protein [Helicobacter fennelliae]|uniref:N-acetylmuramoyl-L-alanine amidase family protein n=1 Tax=Helicobacter fennelliae TaxID=215 RepID=UPI000E1702C5|nr:N-acetylmuramoyl-L-alanine amidase [Helicobacter fennelliae]STP07489.1 N-acetylmuramoyl-L-alanine amidase LytC precursor [Helicobacter fennelliae]
MSSQTCKINDNTPYISLDICICKEKFEKIPIERRDLGIAGDITNYSIAIVGAGTTESMKNYMHNQGISNKLNKIYEYKLMGNFGIFSYLFKKVEGKDNGRAIGEVILETSVGYIATHELTAKTAKTLATRTTSRLGIVMAGRILGGAVGSVIPVGGTILGAIAGAWLAGKAEEWWFSDEDKALESAKVENERIKQLEYTYISKINRINDYLIRNNYVELRELDKDIFGNPLAHSNEAESLCKESSNIYSSYFKTILLMLSFPQYLDRKQEEEKEQGKQERKIQPVKDAILLTLDIEKCIDTSKAELLKEKEIYIYNERFKRVVAKSKSDDKGRLQVEKVSVGKEIGIDRLSFVVDRENLSEDNFDLSIAQYSSITNVQTKHKKTQELKLPKAHFSFNIPQAKLQCDCEVLSLKIHKSTNTITLIPETNLKESRYKPYLQFAYMVFEITDTQIDTSIKNITLQNRQMSGLNSLGNGLKTQYPIKKDWENKVVVFFAFFNTQQKTPYAKTAFIEKPIVVLDIGSSGTLAPQYEQGSLKRSEIISDVVDKLKVKVKSIVALIVLQENNDSTMDIKQKVQIANAIKHNSQSEKILLLSLHIDSEKSGLASGMRCFYNNRQYAVQERKFIARLKEINPRKNNANFEHNGNMYIMKFANIPSVLVTLGFISNTKDKNELNNQAKRQIIADTLFLALANYTAKDL